MKKGLFMLILLSVFVQVNAQIGFEKGYIINDLGVLTQVLIRNVDWKNNPTEIKYKLSEESETIVGDINSIKEFDCTTLAA